MKAIIFGFLLFLAAQSAPDKPSTPDEQRCDAALNDIVAKIIGDPAFARFAPLKQADVVHEFQHAWWKGDTGWRSVSTLTHDITFVPNSPMAQSASPRPVAEDASSIQLDIFIEKEPMDGKPPGWNYRAGLAPGLSVKWYILVKGDASALSNRVGVIVRERFGLPQ